ncbi:MAG: putative kinase [Alphaproteobacteria bacterium]|jgi:predicted kinase
MRDNHATLYLVCGKIAAGKSTLAHRLAAEPETILVSEDRWLSALYPTEINTLQDYVKYSGRLRGVVGEHVESLLRLGLSVALDFPANTVNLRQWMRSIFEGAGAVHELHFLDVPDALCKERLKRRNDEGSHDFAPSEADFDIIIRYFETPTAEEGFNVIVHPQA